MWVMIKEFLEVQKFIGDGDNGEFQTKADNLKLWVFLYNIGFEFLRKKCVLLRR